MLLLLLFVACAPGESSRQPAYGTLEGAIPAPSAPVWLIGLDGAGWNMLDPLLEAGELPHLAALIERGSSGVLRSENPTISPALWATIATGQPRDVHGVVNFTERVPGSYRTVESGPLDRRSPALWDHVGAAGGRSVVVNWFGSFPAETIEGVYLARGLDPAAARPGQVHPEGWLDAGPSFEASSPPGWALEAIGRTPFLRETLHDDQRSLDLLRRAVARESADLVVSYFAGVDIAQHVTWKDMDPDYVPFPDEPPRDPALAQVIPSYYRYLDHVVGEIVALAPEDATIVVVSDHGGGPMRPEEAFHFQLEVVLSELGYIRKLQSGDFDWTRSTAWAISELYRERKRIWLNLVETESQGIVPREQAASLAEEIETRLRGLRVEEGPLFDRIENHLNGEDWMPGMPALTVEFAQAALTATRVRDGAASFAMDPVRLRHRDVSGGHRLDGMMVLAGPKIAPGRFTSPATLYQVAPTVLHLLGLPQDARLQPPAGQGGVLAEVLSPEWYAEHPPLIAEEYRTLPRLGRVVEGDAEADPAEDASLARLRALGYL
ncbi:hypothetical protein ABI59_08680 [Acidobacteria bacterium Mor1]|nr:hypothetical protein ABI59_08680 [Acidobacteria bacterium Mor1]